MATDQYHEPTELLDDKSLDFARVMQSLIEEAEAINWYQQRMSATKDKDVREILHHAQKEEFEHFAMTLEWLSRQLPEWRKMMKKILFTKGDIIEVVEQAEG